jgi:hypothetical protein
MERIKYYADRFTTCSDATDEANEKAAQGWRLVSLQKVSGDGSQYDSQYPIMLVMEKKN